MSQYHTSPIAMSRAGVGKMIRQAVKKYGASKVYAGLWQIMPRATWREVRQLYALVAQATETT